MSMAVELPANVEDIDADDKENPQMASDFVNEIYAYMRQLESRLSVNENYLEALNAAAGGCKIEPKMRNLLVDWLIEVHQQFSLLQETLYLTVGILDRYLQIKAKDISTKQLQLVGITAMFVASKYEEMYPPEIGDFVYISDHTYTATQIRQMEIDVMASLDFELGRPLPLNFLRRNSKAAFVDAQVHAVAKYVMELSVVEYKLAHVAPSVVAAASLAFAMRILGRKKATLVDLWTPTLEYYTSYSLADLAPVVSSLAELVLTVASEEEGAKKKLKAVTKKYSGKKFMKIALIPELKGTIIRQLAQGHL